MASIKIKGVEKLITKLGTIAAMDTMRPPMNRAVKAIYKSTQLYPPERAGQTYRRTYKLKNDWRTEIKTSTSGMVGRVYNNETPYRFYVVDERKQAWMHRGRWWTTNSLADQHRAAIVADFKREIDKVIA